MNAQINGRPLTWSFGDRKFLLPPANLRFEDVFQSKHEAWARARLESNKTFLPDDAYQQDLELFMDRVCADDFAWRSPLSLKFIQSKHGRLEYMWLKIQMGKAVGGMDCTLDELTEMSRQDADGFLQIYRDCLKQDFPDFFLEKKEASPSPTTEQSTESYSSTSQASPGA